MTPPVCCRCRELAATEPPDDPAVCRCCYKFLGELVDAPGGVALGRFLYTPLEEC